MKILNLEDIKGRINLPHIIKMQEEGFINYSRKECLIPPVGYLKIPHTPVRYHIKYGVINNDDIFVVKLAGGLEQTTTEFGTSRIEGMMIVISTKNGKPLYLLQDNGYLTQLRTAVAGLISAKYLAPKNITAIGVLGTGTQAFMQVNILKEITECRKLYIWGRNYERAEVFQEKIKKEGFNAEILKDPSQIAQKCNLIITTTSSPKSLIKASDVKPGTHITAMGADAPGKQELDPYLFQKANIIVVDSKDQCIDHGEICDAYAKGIIKDKNLIELGEIISNPLLGRTDENQITIVDLTGIAVQDIQICKSILSI